MELSTIFGFSHKTPKGYKLEKTRLEHFNSRGHSLADLSIAAIEQVKKNNIWYKKQREEFHIRRFNTFHKGLNRKI